MQKFILYHIGSAENKKAGSSILPLKYNLPDSEEINVRFQIKTKLRQVILPA